MAEAFDPGLSAGRRRRRRSARRSNAARPLRARARRLYRKASYPPSSERASHPGDGDFMPRSTEDDSGPAEPIVRLSASAQLKRTGKEMKFIVHGDREERTADPSLVRLVVRAHRLARRLAENPGSTLEDAAARRCGFMSNCPITGAGPSWRWRSSPGATPTSRKASSCAGARRDPRVRGAFRMLVGLDDDLTTQEYRSHITRHRFFAMPLSAARVIPQGRRRCH